MSAASTSPTPTHPRVLFVGDDASPQIAASLLRRSTADRVTVSTAGTELADPGGRSDEMLVAMGLDPADEQRLSARALRTADRVVVLGPDLDVARVPGPRYEEWDPARDDLAEQVRALADELTHVPYPAPPQTPVRRLLALLRAVGRARRPGRRG